jgi:TonB family protein
MTRWIVGLWIVCVPLAVAAAGEKQRYDPGPEILAALDAIETPCDEIRSTRFGSHIEVQCGTSDLSLKELKKAWRRATRKGPLAKSVLGREAPWRTTAAGEKVAFFVASGRPAALAIDGETGMVALFVVRKLPECHGDRDFIWDSAVESAPERLEFKPAEFPEQARVRGLSGFVLGSYLVDQTGNVIDVCIVAAGPPAVGFEEAATAAMYRSRYEASTEGSRPIAATFFITFELSTQSVPSSLVVEQYFENAYRDRQRP